MGINIEHYRATIGRFYNHFGTKSLLANLFFWHIIFPNFVVLNWVVPNILHQCNDIESNPDPTLGSTALHSPTNYEICHTNMRSVKALALDPNRPNNSGSNSITKMDLQRADMLLREYSILGISETWLDDSYDSNKLIVEGYQKPIRRDHTGHSCGSMVYIANGVPAKCKKDLEPTDSEIVCVQQCIKKLKILVCNCYRPQHRDMTDLCSDIESILDSASQYYQSFIFLGDMNARNNNFWEEDITNTEGRFLKAHFDLQSFLQLVHEATRIQGDSISCIDLIFTNNPSLLSNVSTQSKIYETCDH